MAESKHGVPALLSFFIPGLGQVAKGQVGRGIGFFFGTIVASITIIGGVIVWLWNIADAYNKPA